MDTHDLMLPLEIGDTLSRHESLFLLTSLHFDAAVSCRLNGQMLWQQLQAGKAGRRCLMETKDADRLPNATPSFNVCCRDQTLLSTIWDATAQRKDRCVDMSPHCDGCTQVKLLNLS